MTMDSDEVPLLLQPCGSSEDEEQGDGDDSEGTDGEKGSELHGFWRIVGWLYTQPWVCALILGAGVLIPCILSVYMFLLSPLLDIDLSYTAFEVRSHPSAQRFDALAIALKSLAGSWDRQRRDVDDFRTLREQLLHRQSRQSAGFNNSTLTKATMNDPYKENGPSDFLDKSNSIQTAVGGKESYEDLISKNQEVKHVNNPSKAAVYKDYTSEKLDDHTVHEHLVRRPRFSGGPLYYLQSQAFWKMELVFLAQGEGDANIFTPERLRTVHHVERLVMQHPQFRQFCWKPLEILRDLPLGPSYCSPPSSLLSYLFPSEQGGKIYYDGMGPDLANIQGALSLAITHPQFYWYVDESLTPDSLRSTLLRSEIHFGAPLPSFSSLQDRLDEQKRRFQTFVVQYADILAQQSTSAVKVLYGGTELFDEEVRRTFYSDMLLALFSGACIAALVYILTSFSAFLTLFGLTSIGLSCLVALFLYHVVFGVRYLGILNGVAAFIIVGIGVDDVFVFISTFRQASHIDTPDGRVVYTLKTAGRATFLTSFTTAAAYAANTFSQIPAVHDFGLFMALIVSCCWLWVCMMMPAALCVWSQCVVRQETACLRWCNNLFGPSPTYAPLSDLDDDIALLSVEMEMGPTDLDSDPPLLSFHVDMLPSQTGQGGAGIVSCSLQGVLQHWVAKPVVENRRAVLGIFLIVLLVSAGICCLLRPASHAPVLFRPDTNLQTLLGLRSNLSAQGISCHMCSGLFMEKPHSLHNSHSCHPASGMRSQHQLPGSPNSAAPSPTKDNSATSKSEPLLTVYVSKRADSGAITLYRFSLNATVPSPWTPLSTGNGEVPSFQAFSRAHSNFSTRATVCVSSPSRPRWMITLQSCDTRRAWKPEFSFYVALAQQQHSRKLYFAQIHHSPYSSRLCETPPGCMVSNGPDGPTKGSFYIPLPVDPTTSTASKTSGFNPCGAGGCGQPAARPLVDTGAMVFVVFGILGVNRSRQMDNHVIGDMGNVVYDSGFDLFKEIKHLCHLCKVISANKRLVKPGGAQCLPSGNSLSSLLPLLHPDCRDLPQPNLLPGQLSHGAVGMQGGVVRWVSMAFESTTYKGKSSFRTHADYLEWETFLQEQLSLLPPSSSLRRGYQTCEHWKQIFMEILGVESALYSLLLSLAICVAAVCIFTAHPLLLLPVLLTILGVICLVVTIMYWLGWEMGAVEAISLSILVGSSVDYCLHLVEGFLLAGETSIPGDHRNPSELRQWKTLRAVDHVGVPIVSSAVTTVISTVPLFFCVIVPFSKFGQIVAINTAVSIFYTLTVTAAFLATLGPAQFGRPSDAVLKASLVVVGTGFIGAALFWIGTQLIGSTSWTTILA